MMGHIFCRGCGKEFSGDLRRQFCSRRCQGRVFRARPEQKAKARIRIRDWHRANYPMLAERIQKTRLKTPWVPLLYTAKARAKKFSLIFTLTPEWGRTRWTGNCELTGLPFSVGSNRLNSWSPTIDRIKPDLGYTAENCRFILWAINALKQDGTDEEMFRIAEALIAFKK